MRTRFCRPACIATIAWLLTIPVHAQQGNTHTRDEVASRSWLRHVSFSARIGTFQPSGDSEVFALIDRALTPGSSALRTTLAGGDVRVRVRPRWSILLGAESGRQTFASVSRAHAATSTADVRQQTSLEITLLPYIGAEWQALRWTHRDADRLRVTLGGGAGIARYQLRQWGGFVDVERAIEYQDDFHSSGRGTFGYAGAGVEVPLYSPLTLQLEVRRHVGSAPMVADYDGFNRIDLGGSRLSAGILLMPLR